MVKYVMTSVKNVANKHLSDPTLLSEKYMKKSEQTKLKEKAWKLFSEYIRKKYRDELDNVECYTCGIVKRWQGDGMQAGHAIGGRGWNILFEERVVRPQCQQCNSTNVSYGGKCGNYPIFIPKLIKEIGIETYEELVRESKKPTTLSPPARKEYLKDLIEELKTKLSEL